MSHGLPSILLLTGLAAAACGCGSRARPAVEAPASVGADADLRQRLDHDLTRIINDATFRHLPLERAYDETLLANFDQIEARNAGRAKGDVPRFLSKVTEQEERDHFRETIRRWEAEQGRTLRDALEPLKAEVAARKPDGPRYYPEFHRRFRTVFDDLIKHEVTEMRERRNRAVREEATPLLDRYRAEHPDLVRDYETTLAQDYPVATPAQAEATHAPGKGSPSVP
jgi:hypothetical protein